VTQKQLLKAFSLGLLLGDIAAVNASIFAAYYLRFESGLLPPAEVHHTAESYFGLAIIASIIVPIVFVFQRLYQPKRGASKIDEFSRLFTAVSVAIVVTMAVSAFLSREFYYSRGLLAIAWVLGVIFIWLGRLMQYALHGFLRQRGVVRERVLIVGTGDVAKMILQKVAASPKLGLTPVGFITSDGDGERSPSLDLPVLGRLADIGDVVRERDVQEVIVGDATLSHREILDIVAQCEKYHVNIKVFPDVFQIMASEVAIGDLNGLPMVSIRDVALRGWRLTLKRVFDLTFSSLVLIAVSPLMVLVAILVKITSPDGPVFYVQERIGLDDKPIQIIKFRSMRPDAEGKTGPVWTKKGDDRTTWLGRLLRRFSIDELPQFINVWFGQMSVVGPRPERPFFVQRFAQSVPRYAERHKEKAGLTGWAQVNGLRGDVSIEERTAYDLWYVENWTLWLDFKIILRTLITIFRDKNAY